MTKDYENLLQQIAFVIADAGKAGLTNQQIQLRVQYMASEVHSLNTINSERSLLSCVWRDVMHWGGKYTPHDHISCEKRRCVLRNKDCAIRNARPKRQTSNTI